MEIWDLYDRNGEPTGETAVRGEALPAGRYHIVCETLLRHVDGSFLLMRRDPGKPIHPGEWEGTAGGSALAGEDPLACAKRELLEETGIDGRSFRELARTVSDRHQCVFFSYLAETDADKGSVALQPGETVDSRWVSRAEFAAFLCSGQVLDGPARRCWTAYRELGLVAGNPPPAE